MRKWIGFVGCAAIALSGVSAKDKRSKDDGPAPKAAAEAEAAPKTLAKFTEKLEKSDGLFPLYRDAKTGELFLQINADQLGEEFVYLVATENGPAELGLFRGNFRENRIIQFNRKFGQVEIAAVNTSFYFDPASPLKRAADANISRAPLAVAKIVAESEDGKAILISADGLLKTEALHRISPWQSPDAKPGTELALGELSKDKTQITGFKSFPENTDIRVEYVYDNPKPVVYGDTDVTDARSIAILVQHSFLKMPEPGFTPRQDDFRVGYFTNQVTDLTSASYTPYRDVISRWRLEKKDPSAAVSDPVKPITFWIENTTPIELRDIVRDATLAWNSAFAAAGISNAVEVKIQPDDATWDAGDIRYNVLRWTSSPNPPFGGYGPSFINPRTGEIIGADIMLEYSFLTNVLKTNEVFDKAGLPADMQESGEAAVFGHAAHGHRDCWLGEHLQAKLMAARALLMAQGAPGEQIAKLVRQQLYYLVLHEVGHTLGLNHNMRSTSTVSLADLRSEANAPTNSVMEYPAINIAAPGETQGQFAITEPGAYDVWAIQFGYTPEEQKLPAILARSTEPALAFGNDADDMRAPGVHIDPRVMIGDLSDDPIGWADKQVGLIDQTLKLLPDRVLDKGESYQSLYNSYMALTGQRAGAAGVASRWIGGVFNNRSVVGQPGALPPFQPVPAAQQRRALAVLEKVAFGPDAFAAGEPLLDRLQVERRGFNAFGVNVDPKPHARALGIQRTLLDHLLHPNVLARLTETRRYGGDYSAAQFLAELTGVVFDKDRAGPVNTYRQNLQVEYLTRLIAVASGKGGGVEQTPEGPRPIPNFDYVSRSAALASIARIKTLAALPAADAETRAHRAHLRALIDVFERR